MEISSRTPEGVPHRCPICGKVSAVDPSFPEGDSCCPSCGHLLWWFRDRLSNHPDFAIEQISLASLFDSDLRIDSLQVVELVMEVEEKFDIRISDEEAERIKTVADAIRLIQERM
jgi:acyl carrier protein